MSRAKKAESAKPKTKRGGAGRRKKAETQDETVEVSTGTQLLMGNMAPTRDHVIALETLMHLEAKAKTAGGHVSDHKKKMKEQGINVKAVVSTMKMERMDPLDLAHELKTLRLLMEARGLPIQMQLFEPKFGSVDEQAAQEGYKRGKLAKSPDAKRWPEGSPGHAAHMRSWNIGTQENAKGITASEPANESDDFVDEAAAE